MFKLLSDADSFYLLNNIVVVISSSITKPLKPNDPSTSLGSVFCLFFWKQRGMVSLIHSTHTHNWKLKRRLAVCFNCSIFLPIPLSSLSIHLFVNGLCVHLAIYLIHKKRQTSHSHRPIYAYIPSLSSTCIVLCLSFCVHFEEENLSSHRRVSSVCARKQRTTSNTCHRTEVKSVLFRCHRKRPRVWGQIQVTDKHVCLWGYCSVQNSEIALFQKILVLYKACVRFVYNVFILWTFPFFWLFHF